MEQKQKELIRLALQAREQAYAPYSAFRVGAALEATDGRIFTGCNVENRSYSATICAERAALVKAVSEGAQTFRRIAIVGGKGEITDYCVPCAVCLQAFSEFYAENFQFLLAKTENDYIMKSWKTST